ncbi:MAG: hypothetical protein HKN32_02980, partial [Flavobacteriales bacterium]|nr:hypothetical protein [Flavobacteriales bacterium]
MRLVFTILLCSVLFSCGDKPFEKVVKVFPNGEPQVIHILDGEEGEKIGQRTYQDDGQVYIEGGFRDNEKHGTWYSYYSNGTVWTVNNYRLGEFHGDYKMFNQDGSP